MIIILCLKLLLKSLKYVPKTHTKKKQSIYEVKLLWADLRDLNLILCVILYLIWLDFTLYVPQVGHFWASPHWVCSNFGAYCIEYWIWVQLSRNNYPMSKMLYYWKNRGNFKITKVVHYITCPLCNGSQYFMVPFIHFLYFFLLFFFWFIKKKQGISWGFSILFSLYAHQSILRDLQ